jgi:DNA repair exonuclease SbcCD ATPase subunit
MSEDNQINEEVENELNEANEQENVQEETKEQEQELDPIEQAVQERLAKMKANMDRMAKERDEALKLKAEIEQARKEEQIKRLEEEGKMQEALEMKLAEAQAKLRVFEEANTKLTRDNVVNSALAGLEFRNDRSRDMARRDIVEQLVQNENGAWVHQSGTTIQDFIISYSKNEDNSFLFRAKSNTGAGNGAPNGAPAMNQKKSLAELSTQEVLNLAAKGQLGNFNI